MELEAWASNEPWDMPARRARFANASLRTTVPLLCGSSVRPRVFARACLSSPPSRGSSRRRSEYSSCDWIVGPNQEESVQFSTEGYCRRTEESRHARCFGEQQPAGHCSGTAGVFSHSCFGTAWSASTS